jgi:predicted Rossmann-fold nucleotide-binding protein
MLSWKQIGLHRKPVVLLDALGYWQPLLRVLDQGFAEGFIQPHFRGIYTVAKDPAEAVAMVAETPPWSPGAVDERGAGRG